MAFLSLAVGAPARDTVSAQQLVQCDVTARVSNAPSGSRARRQLRRVAADVTEARQFFGSNVASSSRATPAPSASVPQPIRAIADPPVKPAKKTKEQYVFSFGKDVESPPLDRNLLGGKGNNLCEMSTIGIPVPPGFIITTRACNDYRGSGRQLPEGLREQAINALRTLEAQMGAKLGAPVNPLLVSVRSGARVSMPGMMDTVLNLGCNDLSVVGLAKATGNERLAYDSYRRFVMMYADVVMSVERRLFEKAFDKLKEAEGVEHDVDLSVDGLKKAVEVFKGIYKEELGEEFPQDPVEQMFGAVRAVFNSWDSERAKVYRRVNSIPDDWGTAVVVQSMVFGNKGDTSATGVGFTRNPISGEDSFYGEFLVNAQGEDVVAGIRTPLPINKKQAQETGRTGQPTLEEVMPEVYQQLIDTGKTLEKHYGDMQDLEFTIENGRLYMLQTRSGKRTGMAAVTIAADMLKEGAMSETAALKNVQPEQLSQLLAPVFDQKAKDAAKEKRAAKGFNAGPGAASGLLVLSTEKAVQWAAEGKKVVLVREETSPDDYPGMVVAQGVLTARGGSTSHAAVVARGMGKPCVVGCSSLHVDEEKGVVAAGGMSIKEGEAISIDGSTGEVFFCDLPTSPSEVVQVLVEKTRRPEDSLVYQRFASIMELADKYGTMQVRTNADTPADAKAARAFGAQGIGLCRTEHMFMDPTRLADVRRMFFSTDAASRTEAISRLKKYQKADFAAIFEAMDGLPVTVRLLDPPLHEFIPHSEEELRELSGVLGTSFEELKATREGLLEANPMLGHRGCRLGITIPELTEMQVSAILEAAIECEAKGIKVAVEIKVPLVTTHRELEHQASLIRRTATRVFEETGKTVKYKVGTMIEQPRAALTAEMMAKHAEFFSFGTNDLTQTTFGISRDDAAKFLTPYLEGVPDPESPSELMSILSADPFQKLDQEGVGELMRIAVEKGRRTRPGLKIGICGEHGGEPSSVLFCQSIGLDYVSCSPYRVPLARLAAAQASLNQAVESRNVTFPGAKSWM
eukprot:tig00000344_g24286.t1